MRRRKRRRSLRNQSAIQNGTSHAPSIPLPIADAETQQNLGGHAKLGTQQSRTFRALLQSILTQGLTAIIAGILIMKRLLGASPQTRNSDTSSVCVMKDSKASITKTIEDAKPKQFLGEHVKVGHPNTRTGKGLAQGTRMQLKRTSAAILTASRLYGATPRTPTNVLSSVSIKTEILMKVEIDQRSKKKAAMCC